VTDPQEYVIAAIVRRILAEEGGVADVGDGAGLTRWGQTPGWLQQWRLPVPKSEDEAAMNYRSWLEHTNLDALCTTDDVLAQSVIDYAVNSGERVAIAALQRALGVKADGILGPVTMTSLAICNRQKIASLVISDRLILDNGLITDHPDKYAKFGRNWGHRIARQIRRLA